MKVNEIILTTLQISGTPNGEGILLNVANGYEYDPNGNALLDKIITQKYTIVFPKNNYEKIIVKIKGDKPLITNEQIAQKGGQVKVVLKNLSGRFYRTKSGEYALSASAESVTEVTAQ